MGAYSFANAASAIYYDAESSYIVIRKKLKTEEAAIQKARVFCESKFDNSRLMVFSADGAYGALAASVARPRFTAVLSAHSKMKAEGDALEICN